MYMLELEHETADFEQDVTVMLRPQGSALSQVLGDGEDGEMVELTKAEVDALLAGAGMGELPESGTFYVMTAEPPAP
jgi:uncharacterized protein YjlB